MGIINDRLPIAEYEYEYECEREHEYDLIQKVMDPHVPGAKLDAGKPDLSLLLSLNKALHAVGEVMTFGAKKYTRGGWLSVPDGINRYTAADLRHIFQEGQEAYDSESGLLHAAHHACDALFRLELIIRESEEQTLEEV
jgi:hypothetical protein